MKRDRSERASHPLAPFFRRRMGHLARLMSPNDRLFVRLLPVLLAGRFRRPGFDKEPPGIQHLPRRRKWGRACEAIDFPPPLGFFTTRPLIRSVLVVPEVGGWNLVLVTISERSAEEERRLDERVQMLRLLAARRAPTFTITTENSIDLERLFFAGLAVGDVPFVRAAEQLDLAKVATHAPTPLARALALTIDSTPSFGTLLPGLTLSSPERFAAAVSPDDRLVSLIDQLAIEPGIVELSLASRIIRSSAIRAWRKAEPKARAALRPELRRAVLGSHILPALRPRLEALLERAAPTEVKEGNRWKLELDGHTLLSAGSLDALRARALSESPKLCTAHAEWRRARSLLENRTPRTLFVVEPGFLKHLVLSIGPTGRLRARRLTTDLCIRLALSLRSSARQLEVSVRPGADPLVVSRLSQIAAAELTTGTQLGVQRGERLLLATNGRVKVLPFSAALARPRKLTLLPERAEWLAALRPPRGVAGKMAVHGSLETTPSGEARALFVDGTGRVLMESFSGFALESFVADTRALLETRGASLSLAVSQALASMTSRVPFEAVTPLDLAVRIDARGHLSITMGDEDFGAGQTLGWRALAETVFSHWPPRVRGRVRVVSVESARHDHDGAALEALATRSLVLRRLSAHLRALARFLEAA